MSRSKKTCSRIYFCLNLSPVERKRKISALLTTDIHLALQNKHRFTGLLFTETREGYWDSFCIKDSSWLHTRLWSGARAGLLSPSFPVWYRIHLLASNRQLTSIAFFLFVFSFFPSSFSLLSAYMCACVSVCVCNF